MDSVLHLKWKKFKNIQWGISSWKQFHFVSHVLMNFGAQSLHNLCSLLLTWHLEELLSTWDTIFICQQNMTRSALYSSTSETWSLKDQEVPLFTHPPWKRISGDFSEENPLRKSPTLRLGASAFWACGMTKQRPHWRWNILLARWTDLWRWRMGSLSTRRFFWDSLRESPKKSMPRSGRVTHNPGFEKQAAQREAPDRQSVCAMKWENNLSVCSAVTPHMALWWTEN